jgi:thiamine-monophosphate kinase
LDENSYLAFTGTLGESKRDLELLFDGKSIDNQSKFYEPILRADFIYQARKYLQAGMDISDGLFCDTNKMLEINKYGLKILTNIKDSIGLSGEEYEMLIAFGKQHKDKIMQIAKETNTPLTIFAKVARNDFRFECQNHHF